jgi:hypothetical protein
MWVASVVVAWNYIVERGQRACQPFIGTHLSRPILRPDDERLDLEMEHRLFVHIPYKNKAEAIKRPLKLRRVPDHP